MARKPRIFLESVSQNIVLKGLNNQNIFCDDEDYKKCLEIFRNLNSKDLHIHSFCLLQNQINIYCTPKTPDSLSKFFQNFGRLYVRYFNKKYNRTGTLWDGRYKSSLVEDITYVFDIMKYVEQLPLKMDLVDDLSKYKYSSYILNISNQTDSILTQHIFYKRLSLDEKERVSKYKEIVNSILNKDKFEFINDSLNKQSITGSVGFCKNLEKVLGKVVSSKQRGRPKQIENKGKSMYKKLVVLDKVQHKDLKVASLTNLEFAKDLSFVPVVVNEAAIIAQTFPVVFSADENASLISIISLGGSNLALNNEFKWISKYVPINLRKYPFAMASVKENPEQKIILIDEESSLVSKTKGTSIFSEAEEQTPLLTNAVEFLKNVEAQSILTNNITKVIAESGILEDREITIGEGDEKKILVKGFKVVSKEKLDALSDDILASWVRRGIITFIDAHLKSLENIQTLFELASKNQQM